VRFLLDLRGWPSLLIASDRPVWSSPTAAAVVRVPSPVHRTPPLSVWAQVEMESAGGLASATSFDHPCELVNLSAGADHHGCSILYFLQTGMESDVVRHVSVTMANGYPSARGHARLCAVGVVPLLPRAVLLCARASLPCDGVSPL
jgi:hypothetical protein